EANLRPAGEGLAGGRPQARRDAKPTRGRGVLMVPTVAEAVADLRRYFHLTQSTRAECGDPRPDPEPLYRQLWAMFTDALGRPDLQPADADPFAYPHPAFVAELLGRRGLWFGCLNPGRWLAARDQLDAAGADYAAVPLGPK